MSDPTPRRRLTRALGAVRFAWLLLGVTLLLLVSVELALRLAFAAKDALKPLPPIDPRVVAQGYGGAPWAPALYREAERIRDERAAYVEFRGAPFQGRFHAIDADGLRQTWRAPRSGGSAPVLEVVVLGGSCAWGWGARDDETTPSLIARELAKAGIPARVTNLAQIGYVSTQEALALGLWLRAGNRADVVISYGGVNDVSASLQNSAPGLPQNEANRRREFNLTASPRRLALAAVVGLAKGSALNRLATSAARRLGLARPPMLAPSPAQLPAQTVATYYENLRLLGLLGREQPFRLLAYWQPVIFTKRRLTEFEREKAVQYDWLRAAFLDTRAVLNPAPSLPEGVRFRDLGGLFDDRDDLIFTDFCHTTEAGHAAVAAVIAGDLIELVRRRNISGDAAALGGTADAP